MKARWFSLILMLVAARAASAAPVPDESLNTTLRTFLKTHCVVCHGEETQEADLRLDQTERLESPAAAELWHSVLERVASGEMPPEDSLKPTKQERELAIQLIGVRLELAMARASAAGEWAFPSHGNAVPHEWLFPADGQPPPDSPSRDTSGAPTRRVGQQSKAASPARIWRVGPLAYREGTDELTRGFVGILRRRIQARGNPLVPAPFGLTTDPGFRDYAFRYRVAGSEVEQLARNARMTVDLMLTQRGPRKVPVELKDVLQSESKPTDEQITTAVDYMFEAALRRKPHTVGRLSESSDAESRLGESSNSERDRYVNFTRSNIERLGRRKGLTLGLAAVLMHPEAVFRLELGRGEPDEHGRVMLSPLELAWAIAYALTDRRADDSLMEAVRNDRLSSRDDVQREVQRILTDDEIPKPRILRFFQEYFGYTAAPSVFKDDHIIREAGFQKYYPERLVEDTDRLVLHILESDRNVLHRLLTTDQSFVAVSSVPNWVKFAKRREEQAKEKGVKPAKHPFDKKNKINEHYNFSPEQWSVEMPLQLPAKQRAGILTQPSWLISFSTNEHNHAILRGKWIRERLLGGRIPDTPITVDAQLPDEPEKTLRHRMRVTREDYCWKCHRRMDPLGLPFQMFDHFGRFRTEETVARLSESGRNDDSESRPTVPVNASGDVASSGNPALDGPVENAIALVKRLAESPRVEQVFVRHAFRYWMGRNETRSDAAVMQDAWLSYRTSEGSMQALIVSLLTSDSFLYRTATVGRLSESSREGSRLGESSNSTGTPATVGDRNVRD